ncbi:MAG TPA: DUF3597 domain-containing protein [Haloferula sp.]
MGFFKKIVSKIFGGDPEEKPLAVAATSAPAGQSAGPSAKAPAAPPAAVSATSSASAAVAVPPAPESPPKAVPVVDVSAVLDGLAGATKEKLDWRRSIVDLMKLVGIDSSLSARKELAHELGYTGDTGDSATMNVWLHREVIRQLAANGGQVPEDLLD